MINPVYTLEDDNVVKEYIDAFKYHIDNDQITKKEFETISLIMKEYFKIKGR